MPPQKIYRGGLAPPKIKLKPLIFNLLVSSRYHQNCLSKCRKERFIGFRISKFPRGQFLRSQLERHALGLSVHAGIIFFCYGIPLLNSQPDLHATQSVVLQLWQRPDHDGAFVKRKVVVTRTRSSDSSVYCVHNVCSDFQ